MKGLTLTLVAALAMPVAAVAQDEAGVALAPKPAGDAEKLVQGDGATPMLEAAKPVAEGPKMETGQSGESPEPVSPAAEPVAEAAPAAEPTGDEAAQPTPEIPAQTPETAAMEAEDAPAPTLLEPVDDMTADLPETDTGTAALDDAPDAAVATAPEPDPNIAACRETAGPATAGVAANKDEAAERRAALIAAIEPCTLAAKATDAPADILFLAAEIAQGKRDVATAYTLLELSAGLGFGPAETRLGDYFLFGLAPGGEDPSKAIAHYETAAELGDPAGLTTLALMYRVGRGVPRDATRMVTMLQDAADQGYHFAQYRLAQTYLDGEGIPGRRDDALGIPDPARAAELFTAAAEAGNITAALELAALYADPASGLPENPEAQARLTLMASRAGLPAATAAMGLLYETGRGVPRDPGVAALLYVKALESGEVAFDALRAGAPGGWDRDTAIAFQQILQTRGLYTGALDGVIGPGSAAGARALAGN